MKRIIHVVVGTTLLFLSCTQTDIVPPSGVLGEGKQILSFRLNALNPAVDGEIDQTNKTVKLIVPSATDVTKLLPTIGTTEKATITPISGVAQDFSTPIKYTVRAQNGTQQEYTVTVTKSTATKSSLKTILTFSFNGLTPAVIAKVNETTKTITADMPETADLTKLVPTFTFSAKAIVSPVSGAVQDFSAGTTKYTVTAEDGTKQEYFVNLSRVGKSTSKSITKFYFKDLTSSRVGKIMDYFRKDSDWLQATIDENTKTIKVIVPSSTNVTNLTPTIEISEKAVVSPNSETAQNFTSSVNYTVTAEDGTQKVYVATVEQSMAAKSDGKTMLSLVLNELNPAITAKINEVTKSIEAIIPSTIELMGLTPTITASEKATVSPASGEKVDFTKDATFTVTAEDGSKQVYRAIFTRESSSKKVAFTHTVMKPWFDSYCASCHGNGKSAAIIWLYDPTDYINTIKNQSAVLHNSIITRKTMPINPLSVTELSKFTEWAAMGFPEK